MENNIKIEIEKLIKSFKQLPYLFVGTGLSIRYSMAPSWDALLMDIWKIVNVQDEQKYKKFVKKISYELNLDNLETDDEQRKYYLNPQLATEIQKQFDYKFYNDDKFEKKVFTEEDVKEILDNDYDPFKFYVSKLAKTLRVMDTNEKNGELQSLMDNQNKIAGVITTNYDLILEDIFSNFDVLVGQDSMLTSNTNNIFEIFKIHGSCKDPSSIVITKGDYDYFEKKLKYLSAKLLTLFVEHPIIFIGYSISDVNVREILKEISECLNIQQIEKIKNNFIFVSPRKNGNEVINSKELDFGTKRIKMTELVLEDYSVLYESLGIIKSSMPIKVIRKMQDMVCNFIASTEPNKNINIMVGNIDNPNINDDEVGVYVGKVEVISDMGFDYYGIEDIIEDILFDNKPNLMNKKLIDKTFKNIRSIAGKTYLPVYKYLKGLEMTKKDLPENWHIIDSLENLNLTSTDRKYTRCKKNFFSINEIEKAYSNHVPKQLAYIQLSVKKGVIDKEELGNFLRRKYKNQDYIKVNSSTIKKLVAMYDYMKYN